MKTLLVLLVSCLLLSVSSRAQIPSSSATSTTSPESASNVIPTTINVPTTASELANGYANAISQMTLKSLVIFMKSDGQVIPIKGVRSAQAMGGVLLIVFSAGDRMAINAEQIVMITDGARTPPAASSKE